WKVSRPTSSGRSRRPVSRARASSRNRCRTSSPPSSGAPAAPPCWHDEPRCEDPDAAARPGARVFAGASAGAASLGRTVGAGRRVRMPPRQRRRRLLTGSEKRAIAARLAAGGEAFVAALDALDRAGLLVRDAGVLDKTLHAEWQDALRAAARRLEAAWLALETGVAEERRRWAVETDAIARWRPSLWPVIVGLTPLAAGLIWLGLVLGGYLPAPAWLAG